MKAVATIPMQTVGPIKIIGAEMNGEVNVPLATYESPVWSTTHRGARITKAAGGILVTIIDERMSRSVTLQAPNAQVALQVAKDMQLRSKEIQTLIAQNSRFTEFLGLNFQIVGNLLYLRLEVNTGDAAGHNMVTNAADYLVRWSLEFYPELRYVSVSGNYCTDKKVSAVNGILGRGKYVIAELTIPRVLCERLLRTTPEKLVDLHIKKNLIGTSLAGGIRTANAHFANMLLAFYLAMGQDAANIIEGSQGIVHAEMNNRDLYFSTTLPNIIVGSVGVGKNLEFVKNNLTQLGCLEKREVGKNARRLAAIAAATVLCGELSLLAALTNEGELMRSHRLLERRTFSQDKD